MKFDVQVFWAPKAGNVVEEYEDAFNYTINDNSSDYRFAIADGATESSFAKLWASLLSGGYCHGELDVECLGESISTLSRYWTRQISTKRLPWYAEEKLQTGAFSTIAGITFKPTITDLHGKVFYCWNAVAVGDSCIFQVRGDRVIASFPITNHEDFNNSPLLISSNVLNNDALTDHVRQKSGDATVGDVFYLMTDALACWFLQRLDAGNDVLRRLAEITSENVFDDFLRVERQSTGTDDINYLRNDDVTILKVSLV